MGRGIMLGRVMGCVLAGVMAGGVRTDAAQVAWRVAKSDHFIVHFQEAPSGYIQRLIGSAEAYYHRITEQLGFTRFDEFWTWEHRARIYLYGDRQGFQAHTGQPVWVEAHADVRTREIHAYVNMDNFFDAILPHELGHIIFREFVGFTQPLPLWLDEGIACFTEEQQRPARLMMAKTLVDTDRFIPLQTLTQLGGGHASDPEAFYAEAASVITFLVQRHGKAKFMEYCRRLRDRVNWEQALKLVYGFRDLAEMHEQWVEFLQEG